jgi:hypothetical protein
LKIFGTKLQLKKDEKDLGQKNKQVLSKRAVTRMSRLRRLKKLSEKNARTKKKAGFGDFCRNRKHKNKRKTKGRKVKRGLSKTASGNRRQKLTW